MTSVDELLTNSVRLYPVLYNKPDKFYKDVNKKTLAWEDVAKKTGFSSGNYQKRIPVSLFTQNLLGLIVFLAFRRLLKRRT